LQTNAGKFTQQAEADLTAQGQKKQRDLQRLQEDLQADVDRERNDILQKATTKMSDIVKKIAEEKGYDLVVDVFYLGLLQAGDGDHQRRHRRLRQSVPGGCGAAAK
jgi:vacuolar-type H+-ATPase subunit H